MKKILLLITLIVVSVLQAQIVNIPDVNFKNALITASLFETHQIAKDLNDNYTIIDINGDGEIQESETINISSLEIPSINIVGLTGIEAFINLNELICNNNNLTNLNLNNNTSLSILNCGSNQLATLDLNNNTNLTYLNCQGNQMTNLNVSNSINLNELNCNTNNLTNLNLSNNINLNKLDCNRNHLTNLNLNSNTNLTYLNCKRNSLTSLLVNNHNSLNYLHCSNNLLTNLEISNDINLTYVICYENQLTNLNVNNNINLYGLFCYSNNITNLDVRNNINLEWLDCSHNQLYTLDVSNNTKLTNFKCGYNLNLYYINLKNGNNDFLILNGPYPSNFKHLPSLQTICVDELDTNVTELIASSIGYNFVFTKYCSFFAAQSNNITGNTNIDLDINGCDEDDYALQNMLVIAINETESYGAFTQNDGEYLLYTNEGNYTTSLITNLPSYFTASPSSYTNTFIDFDNTFTADFCITPNQTVNDVNISIIPTNPARPGFNTSFQIVYKNIGTTHLNGNVTLEFDDTKLSFLNASETVNAQTSNSLTFNYTNLNPFETRTIDLVFNVNAPTATQPTNIGDVLDFTATINPIVGDYTTDDNIFTLKQTVIGSYDPNDMTILEGNEIQLSDADKFLHYVIRFQNTGTASAINVVVKNILDNHLDWSTLQLENLSHNNRVAIKNGNEIEFIFENIDLLDSTTDEPNSHGFVAYKIKPKSDIALDDVILNKADIFFDFNEAIETNTTTTTIVNTLVVNENTLLDFSVYPTPTKNILNIKSKTEITKIEIYSKLGQKIKEIMENKINISNLTQGLYFVKVEDINGNFGVKKIMKK